MTYLLLDSGRVLGICRILSFEVIAGKMDTRFWTTGANGSGPRAAMTEGELLLFPVPLSYPRVHGRPTSLPVLIIYLRELRLGLDRGKEITVVEEQDLAERWSATQKLIQYGGDVSGKMGLKEGGGFCHEKDAVH